MTFSEIWKFAKVFISTFVFSPNFFNLFWLNLAAVFFLKNLNFWKFMDLEKKLNAAGRC